MTDERKRIYKLIEERLTGLQYGLVLRSLPRTREIDIYSSACLEVVERFYILTRALMTTFAELVEEEKPDVDFLIELLTFEAELIKYLTNMEGQA